MKIRIKFRKTGSMKFIGHLDVMRYFQKANRRAGVDIAYSGGFSPHQLLSFASPLGLGLTSEGEYLDMEVHTMSSSASMKEQINAVMADGMEVLRVVKLPDGAKAAMASVAAADYRLSSPEGWWEGWKETAECFFSQETIFVWKKTKKSEKEVDIRPFIYEWRLEEENIFLRLAAGSADNLKPELLLEALFRYAGKEYVPGRAGIHRTELYARGDDGESFKTLLDFGEEIP